MRRTWEVAGVLLPLLLALAIPIASRENAENGWKSIRNEDGDRLRWHSCTVEYAIDINGFPTLHRDAMEAAIVEVEKASGLDFQDVPWEQADLKIQLSHDIKGSTVAETYWVLIGDETISAKTIGYPEGRTQQQDFRINLYRHEIGHALGLDHVPRPDTMSNPAPAQPTQTGWRAGLRWLYKRCRYMDSAPL